MLLSAQNYLLIITGEIATWITDESCGILFRWPASAMKMSFCDTVDSILVDTMSDTRQAK